MGCGYDDERAALVAAWSGRLNGHHLFDRLDDARAFVGVTNQRVPEHAPFEVFGLYELDPAAP